MTRGTVITYDAGDEAGYIKPDEDEDRIPFDRKSLVGFREGENPKAGDRVSFRVEGGLAGIWAKKVKRIE